MSLTLIFACQGQYQAADLTSAGATVIHGVANRLQGSRYKPDIVLTPPQTYTAQSAQLLAQDFGEVPVVALETGDIHSFWNALSTEDPLQHTTIAIVWDSAALDKLTCPFDPYDRGVFISPGQCQVATISANSWDEVAAQAKKGKCPVQVFKPI